MRERGIGQIGRPGGIAAVGIAAIAVLVGTAAGALTRGPLLAVDRPTMRPSERPSRPPPPTPRPTRVPTPAPTDPGALACWRGDFEPGHDWARLDTIGGTVESVSEPVAQGAAAGRFTVKATDGVSVERAQVSSDEIVRAGATSWLQFELYLPGVEFRPEANRPVVITQWRDVEPYLGSPPVQLVLRERGGANRLQLVVRGGDEGNPSERTWEIGSIPTDRWVEIRLHVDWSPANGRVAIWLDDERVVSAGHPTIFDGDGVFLKQGLQREAYRSTSTLYIDGTVVAASEAGLACPG